MKKIILCLICLASLTLSACTHDDVPINQKDLPQTAQQFINQYFSDCTIAVVLKDGHEYEVKFTNGYDVEFDRNGNWESVDCQMSPVPEGIVPTPIVNYVQTTYPQNFIVSISIDHNKYDVELNNALDLEFDKNGNFLRIDD